VKTLKSKVNKLALAKELGRSTRLFLFPYLQGMADVVQLLQIEDAAALTPG
jgi:hypothetical protein